MNKKRIAYVTKTSDENFEEIKIFNNLDELLEFLILNHGCIVLFGYRNMIDCSNKYGEIDIDFEIEIYDDFRE